MKFILPNKNFILKRLFDIVSSGLGLLLLSPLFLVLAIWIKCDSPGPVIYKQERIGYGGEPFYIYKFRTMRIDAEVQGPQLACKEDDRLTRTGKFLREHHLDELPQLWNVLKGDMSMVGPRPERQYFINQIMKRDSRYIFIFKMKPGVTSEATLYNGYTDTMEKMLDRLNMDLNYLQPRSLWGDFVILAKTAFSIINGKKF